MGLLQRIFAGSVQANSEAVPVRADPQRPSSANRDLGARSRVINEANAHNDAGRYARALALVDEALVNVPNDPELLSARASTLYEWGRIRDAREWFLRAAAQKVDDPAFPLKVGWTSLVTGFPGEALEWMRKAAIADPGSTKARFGLGVALQANGHVVEAIDCLEQLLSEAPVNYDVLIQLASWRQDRGELAAAEALFRRATLVHPERLPGWTNLGGALSRQDRYA